MIRKIFVSIILIFLLSSCDDTITNSDVDNTVLPKSGLSFAEHIQPIFRVKCTSSGCHNQVDRSGGLSLETLSDVIADPLKVLPGSSVNSSLVWAIEGTTTNPMPPVGYPPLTKEQIEGIRTWIDEGCKP